MLIKMLIRRARQFDPNQTKYSDMVTGNVTGISKLSEITPAGMAGLAEQEKKVVENFGSCIESLAELSAMRIRLKMSNHRVNGIVREINDLLKVLRATCHQRL